MDLLGEDDFGFTLNNKTKSVLYSHQFFVTSISNEVSCLSLDFCELDPSALVCTPSTIYCFDSVSDNYQNTKVHEISAVKQQFRYAKFLPKSKDVVAAIEKEGRTNIVVYSWEDIKSQKGSLTLDLMWPLSNQAIEPSRVLIHSDVRHCSLFTFVKQPTNSSYHDVLLVAWDEGQVSKLKFTDSNYTVLSHKLEFKNGEHQVVGPFVSLQFDKYSSYVHGITQTQIVVWSGMNGKVVTILDAKDQLLIKQGRFMKFYEEDFYYQVLFKSTGTANEDELLLKALEEVENQKQQIMTEDDVLDFNEAEPVINFEDIQQYYRLGKVSLAKDHSLQLHSISGIANEPYQYNCFFYDEEASLCWAAEQRGRIDVIDGNDEITRNLFTGFDSSIACVAVHVRLPLVAVASTRGKIGIFYSGNK